MVAKSHPVDSPLEGEAPPDVSGSMRGISTRLMNTHLSDSKLHDAVNSRQEQPTDS